MVQISRYQTSDHDLIDMMHMSNDMQPFEMSLPQIGYIATEGSIPVAAGFLRMIEGGFAQIDTLVSNKQADSSTRHQGLKLVIDELIKTANQLKLKGIISITSDKSVIYRAVDTGFKVTPNVVITLQLQE